MKFSAIEVCLEFTYTVSVPFLPELYEIGLAVVHMAHSKCSSQCPFFQSFMKFALTTKGILEQIGLSALSSRAL